MSKKHFESFAAHIRGLNMRGRVADATACYNMIVENHDNPRFDRERFYRACGFRLAKMARVA